MQEFLGLWQEVSGGRQRLLLTPDWLKGWFYCRICAAGDAGILDAYVEWDRGRRRFSPEETLTFLKHLATLALYLIWWLEWVQAAIQDDTSQESRRRPRFAEVENGPRAQMAATLYLICEYAHLHAGLTRRAELFHTLEAIWSNEAVLYTIRDTYRDHINHMVETCLLGLLLMGLKTPSGKYHFSHLCGRMDPQRMLRNWIVAALLHDTGYALEICRLAAKSMKFMDAPQLKRFAAAFGNWFAGQEKDTLDEIKNCLGKALNWLQEPDLRQFDHGVISAYFTMFLVTDGKDPEPEVQWRWDMRPALDSMARHNLKRYPTSYAQRPLAFLLVLCDHLQEWDRPLVEGMEMRQALVVHLLGMEWSGLDRDSLVKYLEVEGVEYRQDGVLVLRTDGSLDFRLYYQSRVKDRYHPPLVWVGHSYSLQNLSDCPGEITIKMIHPAKEGRAAEMGLFQAFLRQEGLASLRGWALTSRGVGNWIEYNPETRGREDYETFFFRLHLIPPDPTILKLPEKFVDRYLEYYCTRYPFR
jgi:hypothetical protein